MQALNLYHFDLKIENIIISNEGKLFLIDFEDVLFMKDKNDSYKSIDIFGTPYMYSYKNVFHYYLNWYGVN